MNAPEPINLELVAHNYGIDLGTVISKVKLAVALHMVGLSVREAAEKTGVGKNRLHATVKSKKEEKS